MRDDSSKNQKNKPKKAARRSESWFNDPTQPDQTAIYVERYMNYGLTREELQAGKPIIGIAQSGSDLTPCNRHHIELAKRVRDGIRTAGGIAMEFPVHPIHEMARRPTAALDRNLSFLGLVEILYGYPLDGVVLTTGCDKTTPAMLMAAAAVDIPAIVLSGGPMLNGWDNNKRSGSGAVIWECRQKFAAGEIDYEEFMKKVCSSATSTGHCNTMGTALTMNCVAEALGMSLPGSADIPAPHQSRAQVAYETGRRAVELVEEDLTPSKIMTQASFRNAIKVVSAIGGSSNAPIHLQAIAKQLPDISLSINDWQSVGENIPLLVNCQPAGMYLGEDFHRAGGLAAVMGELHSEDLLDSKAMTVTGKSVGENYSADRSLDQDVIKPVNKPLLENAGFAVLSSNFFNSAVMKKSVISPEFRKKYLANKDQTNICELRAIVFDGPEHYHQTINDPALAIDENCLLVIRYCGPLGYPGSAEVVNMIPPNYLIKQGVNNLPCLGDGRQSGTSASPSILNVSPEAAAGGGLALIQNGDLIRIDLNENRVDVLVSDEALNQRRKSLPELKLVDQTPWQEIYRNTVGQLEDGATMELENEHHNIIKNHGTPRHSH